ncbi:MAG: serpin family protein [Candidatus Cloacimonetes bacterium]|nr:serpin family protein [Candidatus Cloacimonadota bacterium]
MKRFYLFILAILVLFACTDTVTSPDDSVDYARSDSLADAVDEELIAANLRFAINVFKKLDENSEENENIFISPLSLSVALAMTYNGADGETKDAMATTLELQNLSLDWVNEEYLTLIQSFQGCDTDVDLCTANSIWIRLGFPVKQDFINAVETYYLSEVFNLDFLDPNAPDIINSWVEENTNGKITNMIQQIIPAEVMFLINALYFLGNWKYEFDESDTQVEDFFLPDGSLKPVPMMKNSGNDYYYFGEDSFFSVRMPYGRDKIAMYIFLPNYFTYNLDDFFEILNADNWNNWMCSYDSLSYPFDDDMFKIPKFKLEYEKIFNDILIDLGMGVAFTPSANFSGITDEPLWINYVKQKAYIEVNEQGTEAAAATMVSMASGILPGFIANRPFFFVIQDDRSGAILFMGKIVDPSYE